MNTMQIALANKSVSGAAKTDQRRRNWTRILYLCGGSGLAMSLCRLLLSAAAFFRLVANAASVNRTGTWLMVVAFPIVMCGAHALDKIGAIDETANKNRRAADEKIAIDEPPQWK